MEALSLEAAAPVEPAGRHRGYYPASARPLTLALLTSTLVSAYIDRQARFGLVCSTSGQCVARSLT
jgi:hypothetical protein